MRRRKRWRTSMAGRLSHEERGDLDPIPQPEFANGRPVADPVASRAPGKRSRLPIHRDRAEVAPVMLACRRRQRFGVRAPVGREIERHNALAFGFGGATAGHAASMRAPCSKGEMRRVHRYTAIPSVPDFPGAGAVCRADFADGIRRLPGAV